MDRIDYHEGSLDDVVLSAESIHMEILSDKCLWIGIDRGGEDRFAFTVTTDRKLTFTQVEGILDPELLLKV